MSRCWRSPRPGFLGIQEINRKGRISPSPRRSGARSPQLSGPAGEPAIKSEFARMFSGIGSGVGAIASPIPTRCPAALHYGWLGKAGRPRYYASESNMDSATKSSRETSARTKRRKLKEDNDDESNGRATPTGSRAKKAKTHAHHHHQYALSCPKQTRCLDGFANKSTLVTIITTTIMRTSRPLLPNRARHRSKMSRARPLSPRRPTAFRKTPPSLLVHAPRSRVQNPKTAPAPPPSPPPVVVPKPHLKVLSSAVLESVADLPQSHLGDVVYETILKPARLQDKRTGRPPRHGFSSTPKPLPRELIDGKENCTLTVKIGKEHLTRTRERRSRPAGQFGEQTSTPTTPTLLPRASMPDGSEESGPRMWIFTMLDLRRGSAARARAIPAVAQKTGSKNDDHAPPPSLWPPPPSLWPTRPEDRPGRGPREQRTCTSPSLFFLSCRDTHRRSALGSRAVSLEGWSGPMARSNVPFTMASAS